jgi:hypothetical protein
MNVQTVRYKILLISWLFLASQSVCASTPMPELNANTPIGAASNPYQWTPVTVSSYAHLSQARQTQLAAMWGLTIKNYEEYLHLMEETPNGWYYRDQRLDPNWILGLNATDTKTQRQYIVTAIQNERVRIASLLAFQKAFNRIQWELYPAEKAFTFDRPRIPVTCR